MTRRARRQLDEEWRRLDRRWQTLCWAFAGMWLIFLLGAAVVIAGLR